MAKRLTSTVKAIADKMASAGSKASGSAVKEMRILLCPEGKTSEGARSFLNEHLGTLRQKLPGASIMVREAKGTHPQIFVRLEKGKEQQFALESQTSKAIFAQIESFLPRENPDFMDGKNPYAGSSAVAGRKMVNRKAMASSSRHLGPFHPVPKPMKPEPPPKLAARPGVVRPKSVARARAALVTARLGKAFPTSKSKEWVVVHSGPSKAKGGLPAPACNELWNAGSKGPESWDKKALGKSIDAKYGDAFKEKPVLGEPEPDSSGISQAPGGLPTPACNHFWGHGKLGPRSWPYVKLQGLKGTQGSDNGTSGDASGLTGEAAPALGQDDKELPKPACSKFSASGSDGPATWAEKPGTLAGAVAGLVAGKELATSQGAATPTPECPACASLAARLAKLEKTLNSPELLLREAKRWFLGAQTARGVDGGVSPRIAGLPEPACNAFWANGAKGPHTWRSPNTVDDLVRDVLSCATGKAWAWAKHQWNK